MNKIATLESSSRLAVTYRPVGDLIPDPRNARTHPKRQIDQIRASIYEITPATIAQLAARPWPGNIRELRNMLARFTSPTPTA